jgi:4-hydroxy-2-oxoheptanedioate aldolase
MAPCTCPLSQRLRPTCAAVPGAVHPPLRATFAALKDPATVGLLLSAGFEAVVVDREHGVMSAETAAALVTAAHAVGGFALVRVPAVERAAIQDALEAGADGILAPMVESAADAARLVSYCRYPPEGTRGFHPLTAGSGHGRLSAAALPAHANARLLVAAQVETAAGLAACAALAAVPGLDQLFLGPGDLALSLGLAPGAPQLAEAAAQISRHALQAGKSFGAFVPTGAAAAEAVRLGARLLVAGADVALLHGAARALAADVARAGGTGP